MSGDNYKTSWVGLGTSKYPFRDPNYDRGQYVNVLGSTGSALYLFQYDFLAIGPFGLTDGFCVDYSKLNQMILSQMTSLIELLILGWKLTNL